jgi:aminoglycoside 3-N-acetyltransferase
METENSYFNRLVNDLRNIGVMPGDTLMVHSSLRSVGDFPDRAMIVTRALLEVLGSEGTLVMPALSYLFVTRDHPVFVQHETPTCVGALTEYFRTIPGVERSIHPTHSVCAIGKNTTLLLHDHHLDNSPCGARSPFTKLKHLDGKILFLGCGLMPNTSMHAIEELSIPPYLYGDKINYSIHLPNHTSYQKDYTPHGFKGYNQRYDRIIQILHPHDFRVGQILKAQSYLVKSSPLWIRVEQKLREDPFFFVEEKQLFEE